MRAKIGLVMALSFFICLACEIKGESPAQNENPLQDIKKVKVSAVKAAPLRGSIEYIGALTAHLKVNVSTEMGGTIEKLFFERGDRVNKGQILAEISTKSIRLEVQRAEAAMAVARSKLKKTVKGSRPEEIRIAKAALEQAKANFNEAESHFKRIKDLYGDNAISNSDYDSAKRAVDTTRSIMQSAGEQLELARQGPRIEDREAARANLDQAQAALAMAKDRLRKSRLHSPSQGIIAFRQVEEGEVVGPGSIITKVVDNSRMKINLSLPEKDITNIQKNKVYLFTIDAFPGKEFACRLMFLSPTAEPVTRSFPLELLVDEPDPRMADGMTVRVKFPLVNEEKSIKVPSAWLSEENGKMGLFVVEDGKAFFRKVTLGSYYEQKVEIVSGISDQALVITNPSKLKSGEKVTHISIKEKVGNADKGETP
ncbi:MAG: efflux RND transporter periplasmic adaptor subunit [Thermodesulfobacteriota bacterium]|nr:efflux RND transporter periplasmic adaptor subunit [Thermodesulfobacteriota bacterium]